MISTFFAALLLVIVIPLCITMAIRRFGIHSLNTYTKEDKCKHTQENQNSPS
jgi:ACR3 family arsenite efflux pump ArsB